MPASNRRPPAKPLWAPAILSVLMGCAAPAWAASEADSAPAVISNSAMDAPLFYQLLIGELELNAGQAGTAYQVLLDAARRTQDQALFKRVVSIALQARAGEQALIAAKAWRDASPDSIDAHQSLLQLLALLNKPAEAAAPLKSLLALTPAAQRGAVLASLPQLFQRAPEPKQVLAGLKPTLQEAAQQPDTRMMGMLVLAKLEQVADEVDGAMALTRSAASEFPDAEEPLILALDLMGQRAEAETLIRSALQAKPDNHGLRQAYGRALARAQRPADAAREFRLLTEQMPDNPSSWLALGSLELELGHAEAADGALRSFLKRLEGDKAAEPELSDAGKDARQQAWLLLAHAAEMRGELKAAEAWLLRVDAPQRQMETQLRRASLLARQGKLAQARQLIQALPGEREQDLRAKLLAEAQLLRDAREWAPALDVLSKASERFPDDADLIYERSMMAEKLGRTAEMEALLRKVIELRPSHYHAYNALGYSLADRKERLPEARELIAKALSFAPQEPFIVDSMGWVEYRMGKLDEAERLLRQAYGSRPDAEIAAHLGEVLWAAGQRDEAKRIWAEGSKRDPKNEALRETMQRLKAKP
ncbi:tetratricopeptide repeat protein [Paucibacter sediminis]|uniref:Tetratricopeptide repeat protein n=1 Tax=Paucibacter sediminis TaxID=3019553 RepID=A0AA95NCB9_9BURK|nr:tetratricopeptide repeat protein [Paucibacter sp. S2-9]WIT12432.1 tetratricopeptide repeat protein [Paucibacter sp. S2-9]